MGVFYEFLMFLKGVQILLKPEFGVRGSMCAALQPNRNYLSSYNPLTALPCKCFMCARWMGFDEGEVTTVRIGMAR